MARYAESTEVSSDRSRAEIERTIVRYGAHEFAYGWGAGGAQVQFSKANRTVRFELPMPDRNDNEFILTPTRKKRSPLQAQQAYEQAVRQRWRALNLVIKAKLEAVEAGISEFDEEFLAYVVTSDGATIGKHLLPRLNDVVLGAPMLPALGSGE